MKILAIVTLAVVSVATSPWTHAFAAGTQQDLVKENFLQADANADGALTLDEFKALIDLNAEDNVGRAAFIRRTGKQSMAFGRLDADANGLVTTDEISAMTARVQQ